MTNIWEIIYVPLFEKIEMRYSSNPYFTRRTECPVCSSNGLFTVYKRSYEDPRIREYLEVAYHGNVEYHYLEGQDFEIVECESCRFLFQRNVLSKIGAQRLYDVWIDPVLMERHNRQKELITKEFACSRVLFVNRYLRTSDIKMLDYGAGFGDFCLLSKGFNFEVSALEFSEERLAFIKNLGITAVAAGKVKENYYHFISLHDVLEHLTKPLEALRDVHRALCDDGLVSVAVPNCSKLRRKLRAVDTLSIEQYAEAMRPCAALQHINSFTRSPLKLICERAGFKIIFRPFLLLGCRTYGVSPKEILKNFIRPFFHSYLGTTFFLRKST